MLTGPSGIGTFAGGGYSMTLATPTLGQAVDFVNEASSDFFSKIGDGLDDFDFEWDKFSFQ